MTVQPPFSTIHCKTLNIFIKVCYTVLVVAAMSPRRTLSLPSNRTPAPGSVSARDRVFLFNSFLFTLFQTLLHSRKTQLFCFQSTTNSFAKTPGVGGRAISVSRSIRGCLPSSVHSSKFRIPQVLYLPLLRKLPGCVPKIPILERSHKGAHSIAVPFFSSTVNCRLLTRSDSLAPPTAQSTLALECYNLQGGGDTVSTEAVAARRHAGTHLPVTWWKLEMPTTTWHLQLN